MVGVEVSQVVSQVVEVVDRQLISHVVCEQFSE